LKLTAESSNPNAERRCSDWNTELDGTSVFFLLVANGQHNCISYTKAYVRLRTTDVEQKSCPKHVE